MANCFQAGFGKVDVTPLENLHLGSFNDGMRRFSETISDRFDALTLALTDEAGQTIIFIVTDLSWGHIDWSKKIRGIVKEKFGIPGDRVMLAGTHNHNGPDWYSEALHTPANTAYFQRWQEGVIASVEMALADRKPAAMQIGRTQTQKLGFVRRYIREDGNLAGGGYQKYYVYSTSPLKDYETVADEEIQMVRFIRQGGKDILLGQWQNHGCHVGWSRNCSTDWLAPMRKKVEENIDAHYIYFQGAAGNLATVSRLPWDYRELSRIQVGEAVADTVIAAWNNPDTFHDVKTGKVKVCQEDFTSLGPGPSDEPSEWTGELNTISFGDVSVVTFPVEVFDTIGKKIKAGTPFEMTVLMGYANGIHGYVPDTEALLHGGYEAHSRAVPGTAERMIDTYLQRLNEQHEG